MIKYLLFIGLVLFEVSCKPAQEENKTVEQPAPVQNQILIFGSSDCDHCTDFMAALDSMGLQYTFNDVNGNEANKQQMFDKVKEFNFTEYIQLPVVIVNNKHFLAGPSADTIPTILAK
ncbi:MAG TPA: glutaredoxin domain-containing protein [Saprospiraceae bacterium]|nr:glutaredoxin domain-containing protein [Saprospiraceae bacterium]